MNRDDVIRMALDAGAMPVRGEPKQLAIVTNLMIERFAALVAAAEREACAAVVEPKSNRPCDCERCECGNSGDLADVSCWDALTFSAAAIRARGDE